MGTHVLRVITILHNGSDWPGDGRKGEAEGEDNRTEKGAERGKP
jgi:hypothetical protein